MAELKTQNPELKSQNSLASQVSRALVWNTAFVPLRLLAQLLSTLLKLNLLAPASYGLLSLIGATNNAIGTWIDLGTGRALPKYIPETLRVGGPGAMRRLLGAVLGVQVALLGLVALGFAVLHDTYLGYLRRRALQVTDEAAQAKLLDFVGAHGWLIIAVVLVLLLMGIVYDVFMAYLSSFFKQRIWNTVALAAGVLPPLLTASAILLGGDVLGVLLAMAAAPTIAVALLLWQAARLWTNELGSASEARSAPAGSSGAAAAPLLPAGFIRYCGVSYLMTATDYLASAGFAVFFASSLVDVALLTAGVSIVQMVLGYLFTPMVGVQVPLFTRVRQGEGGTLLGAYQSTVRLQVLLLVPGGVGLLLLAGPIFALLSPQYAPAAPLVWVLAPALFLECLLTTAHNALIVYEKLRTIVISRLLTLVSVPLVIWLTPLLGVAGAALAFGLARVLAGLWVTGSGVRLLGLRWPWRFTLRVLLASLAMGALVAGLRLLVPPIPAGAGALGRLLALPALLGVAAAGGAAFLAALRLLGGLDARDREQLATMRLPGKKWLLKLI